MYAILQDTMLADFNGLRPDPATFIATSSKPAGACWQGHAAMQGHIITQGRIEMQARAYGTSDCCLAQEPEAFALLACK